mmetsp:Transcript_15409/g.11217  ORF Transcript_15409/g.11217 Transcript_15409/m.11217 type:complete len:126 (-) Transcript_15409:178-555(-)
MASANGHAEIVKVLLENGADPNVINEAGNTALHWAALNGKEDVVKLLLQYKADPNLKNTYGRLPIEEALQHSHTSIAEFLAPITVLDEDKIYTSLKDIPEDEEEEKKGEEGYIEEDQDYYDKHSQ